MTLEKKYPGISKEKMTLLAGRVSKLYDAGYTAKEIAEELNLSEELTTDLVEVKEAALKNR